MSANVETMMYTSREVPWHLLGTSVQEAPTSLDALHLAGLDWNVNPMPVYNNSGIIIPNYVANTRSSDESVLGIVTERYKIVQNSEAFAFTDALLGEGVTYETAGSLNKGKKIWLLAKMPETVILEDVFVPYLCFTSTHDGTGSVKVAITPTRVVCNNTLNIALRTAVRTWSTKHTGDIEYKLEDAQNTLKMATKYMKNLSNEAEVLVNKNMTNSEINDFIEQLFPIADDETLRKQNNIISIRDYLTKTMDAPDIADFRNTAWGVVNAVSDMICHMPPQRNTETFAEKRFDNIIEGHAVMDEAYKLLKVA